MRGFLQTVRRTAWMLALIMLLGGTTAQAAVRANPADVLKAGEEVKTAYFHVTIPDGWLMPQKVRDMAKDALAAIFTTDQGNIAVAFTVMKSPGDLKAIATQTAANMRKKGMDAADPVEENGLYVVQVKPKPRKNGRTTPQAVSYFGSNGKECAITTITGNNPTLCFKQSS